MADELNTPTHRWYERRNNIALAKKDVSAEFIYDSGIQKINSWINNQPWGFDYPQLVLDFDNEYYRVDGGDTTFANAITHTRASTATYVDSTGTLQTAAINEPRLGHHVWNGSAWVNEGLLHESEARTNLIVRSEEFDSGSWAKTRATVTADDALAPDGLSTADRIIEDTETGTHQALISGTIAADSVNTVSIFVKAGTGSDRALRIDFRDSTYTDGVGIVFNPHTGVVVGSSITGAGSNLATSVQNAGNGWYRISLTGKLNAVATSTRVILYMQSNLTTFSASYTGDGASNLLLYGAQLETGPTPSSYIPTAGSAVTRAADVLTVPAANLPYNSTALSIQMDGRVTYADTNNGNEAAFVRWWPDSSNYIYIRLDTNSGDGQVDFFQNNVGVVDDVQSAVNALTPAVLSPFNIASRHGSTFINGAVDGTALTANTTPVALPDLSATNLQLGFTYNGTLRTFRMWGQDITDAGLVEATT